MKTPREILFQRHEAAGPKLDALRHEVVARHCASAERDPAGHPVDILTRLWLELFCPCRHFWSGLAAVWVVLLLVNLSQQDRTSTQLAQSAAPAAVMMTFYNQEKLLNELLADRTQPLEATRPPKFEPKPRSEIAGAVTI